MRESAWAFACGLVFGAGLVLSGMTDPANIQAFLDVAGAWRPQLAGVMGAAVVVTASLYAIARRRARPALAGAFEWPTLKDVDARLVAGAVIFGTGWALAGYCPGPALTSLGAFGPEALVFVAAMAARVWAARAIARKH
jgi:uncharacterized membrane protein YedE/YeeE